MTRSTSRNHSTSIKRNQARLVEGAVKSPQPRFIEPCLATLAAAPPKGADWLHEIKFDGYRVQAHIDGQGVRLFTRKGLDWTKRFGNLSSALQKAIKVPAIIDGEIVVEHSEGHSSFSALAEALKAEKSDGFVYQCFDLLFLDGLELRNATLINRKALLADLLGSQNTKGPVRYSSHLQGDGAAMLREACRLGLEGLISKRADRAYHSGRHDDWLKSKCIQTDEFVIGGYLRSNVSAKAVGALSVGYRRNRRLIYAGRVGTGFSTKMAEELFRLLQPLKRDDCPFYTKLTGLQRRNVVWVEPKVVAQTEYRAWTGDNLLRHAAFKALREDKPAGEVRGPARTTKTERS